MGKVHQLLVYKKSFSLAMEIFTISKKFPVEERYSLTDQVRRSSRSTNINLCEAYRKRQYPAHFVSKISDSDMENAETQGWLAFAFHCEYINESTYNDLIAKSEEVGRLLYDMIANPEKYKIK